MRRVTITEDILNHGAETYYRDDQKAFDDATAKLFIDAGWAKDTETGETGERRAGAGAKINPKSMVQATG